MIRNPKTITALLILAVSFVGGVNATEDELSEKQIEQMRLEEQRMIEQLEEEEQIPQPVTTNRERGGGGVDPVIP